MLEGKRSISKDQPYFCIEEANNQKFKEKTMPFIRAGKYGMQGDTSEKRCVRPTHLQWRGMSGDVSDTNYL